MDFTHIFAIALLVEFVWESLKPMWPNKFKEWDTGGVPVDKIGAFVIAQVFCFAYGADLPALLGMGEIPYLGIFATGALMYRGSGFFHDAVKALQNYRRPINAGDGSVG